MLKYLFPKNHMHYSSLPVLGALLNEFAKFLAHIGYPPHVIRVRILSAKIIDQRLRRHKCHSVKKITLSILRSCSPMPGHAHEDKKVAATAKLLERYFNEKGIFPPPKPPTSIEIKINNYGFYLKNMRCLSPNTIHSHCATASLFLGRFNKCGGLRYLSKLSSRDIENFVRDTGNRVNRRTLAKIITHLRSLLHFLGMCGDVSLGLSNQIDTPRIYREEQLPISLDWKVVCALMKSIDRSSPIGKRDYAMLILITTYGLRSSEIVTLKLEDIKWREKQLQVFQPKTSSTLLLPLTDAVGKSIIDYLRKGRPLILCREIFVRHRAPSGTLKPTAVKDVFRHRMQRSGLSTASYGAHTLRHSYAIHLLRQGVSLKTIGDLLGHRNFSSTCAYLRLNIEDLRTVPLSFPVLPTSTQGERS